MFVSLPRLIILGSLCNILVVAEPLVHDLETNITYQGTIVGDVEHFQNIKFAHDTSGPRRFAPPEPYTPAPGSEVDASSPGAACPQIKDAMLPFFSETQDMSEDCLNLRIARSSRMTETSKLPVVLWVHGGGVVKGSAYDPHFDPDKLLQHSVSIGKPVIYVAINYRLTIFGFARLPLLKARKSLNVGIRDQRLAFQWVKDNIEKFGGDPDKITVYGLSAGGTFTSLHLVAYGGKRSLPFSQAWVMSGPPGTALNMSSDATTTHTLAVAERLKCDSKDEAALLQCLRNTPMNTLLTIAMEYSVSNHPPAGLFTFIPSVDGDMFPDRPSVLYREGNFVKGIPMVFGWTQDDGAMNAGPAHLFETPENMISSIKSFSHALTKEDYDALLALYDPEDFAEDVKNYNRRKDAIDPTVPVHYFRLSRILRDMLFTCSSIDFGYHATRNSRQVDPNFAGVRLYTLNQSMLAPLWKGAGMPYVGVAHGSDTNYIFNGLFPEGPISESDEALSEQFTEAFLNFAYDGQPTSRTSSSGLEVWPEAFTQDEVEAESTKFEQFGLQIVGGPYGTGAASVGALASDAFGLGFAAMVDPSQQALFRDTHMGEMQVAAGHFRNREMERERLLQRCALINSLSEKLGV